MNIAFLVKRFPVYSETFIINQINSLIDLGHDVTIFTRNINQTIEISESIKKHNLLSKLYTLNPDKPKSKLARIRKAIDIYLKNPPVRNLVLISINPIRHGRKGLGLHYVFQINQLKDFLVPFDIVHAHFGPDGKIAYQLQKLGILNARKTIVSFHGYDVHEYEKAYYQDLFDSDYVFTVNSEYTRKKLIKLGSKNKIVSLPMGLDERYLKNFDKTPNKTITIITVARLVPVKGIEYGIKAIKKLVDRKYLLQYLIIGEGELKEELIRLIKELELMDHVILLGAKDPEEVYDLYKSADIFILPSITTEEGVQEAQGLVLQEAQAMKIPVIATDTGGISEGLLRDETGFIVPEKNPEALADKIAELIDVPALRKEMGEKGSLFAKQKFDNKILTKRLIAEVYES